MHFTSEQRDDDDDEWRCPFWHNTHEKSSQKRISVCETNVWETRRLLEYIQSFDIVFYLQNVIRHKQSKRNNIGGNKSNR